MKRIVVLISGSGSNLQAIIDGCENGSINGQIVAVMSNRPRVMGLQRAVKAGCDAITIDHTTFDSRESFDETLAERIQAYQPDLVVLAGFMRILTDTFVQSFEGKMLNIHPSLLPKYPGLDTHQRALEAGDSEAGATVHFVTAELDGGPLVAQAKVSIVSGDTLADLNKRVLAQEHVLYPTVIEWFCDDRLTYSEGSPKLDDVVLQFPELINNN